MIGQWEFQIGPLGPLEVADQLWIARWLLYRTAEDFDVAATLDPKPMKGDWNGAGAHTNLDQGDARGGRLLRHREGVQGARQRNWEPHIKNYGHGIEDRLTGHHETAPWNTFTYGVSDRGASSASRCRSSATAGATSRTVARTPTWTPTWWPGCSPTRSARRSRRADRRCGN